MKYNGNSQKPLVNKYVFDVFDVITSIWNLN